MHTDSSELRTARRVNVDSVFRWPSFSHAVLADGHIYLSGVMGTVGTELPHLADGGTAGQTRQALRNLEQVLARCGASLVDLVKVTVYLSDIETFLEMDGAYMEFVTTEPARVTVGCSSLSLGAAVEIDAIAFKSPD
jgi:2-iminobutanoate/2-iminopropanoate deaminase